MTANVITYRGRSAAREVGKALGFEITSLEKLSGLVRRWDGRILRTRRSGSFTTRGST